MPKHVGGDFVHLLHIHSIAAYSIHIHSYTLYCCIYIPFHCKVGFARCVKLNFMNIRRKCLNNVGPISSSCC